MIVTDGRLDREAAALDLPATLRQSRQLHPRDAARYVAGVLDAAGRNLNDDATILILDWRGPHHTELSSWVSVV